MALFKKEPPKACPKCGKADSWHVQDNESQTVEFGDRFRETLRPGGYSSNQFTDMRIQGRRNAAVSLTYICDSCGYKKTY